MKSNGASLARLGAALVFLSSVCRASTPPPAAVPPPPAAAAAFDSGEESVKQIYAGRKAYQEKDYAQAVRLLEQGARAVPGQPDVVLDLARAYAHSGDKERALAQLDRLATLGFGDRVANAEAFASLHDDPRFQAVAKKIAAACAPVGKSRAGFAFTDAELIPGGMDYDPGQRLLYIGSFAKNKILAVTLDGKARDFTTSGQDGLGNVLALRVDTKRNELLATSAAMGADGKGTGLFRYDLKSGKLLGKVIYESHGVEGEQLNDVIPTPSGDILVSEAASGNLFRLKKGGAKLEPILADKTFVYPNVLLLAPDGRHLYVANVRGLARVDLETKRIENMPAPPNASLSGLDGLYRYGDRVIATQNGVFPARLVEFTLNPKGDAIVNFRVLEARTPEVRFPTTGAIVGRQLYFIADSPFDLIGPDGKIPPEKLQPSHIRVLDIG